MTEGKMDNINIPYSVITFNNIVFSFKRWRNTNKITYRVCERRKGFIQTNEVIKLLLYFQDYIIRLKAFTTKTGIKLTRFLSNLQ